MPINDQINAKEVLVIGPNGEQLGVRTKEDALILATAAGFDLVAVNINANPPVCKLLDYNKFRYERIKKAKEAYKKQREKNLEIKEFRLSPNIDKHDFDTKLRNVAKYLEKGNKIKTFIRFKGREALHHELGKEVLLRFANALKDIADIEQEPKLDGRTMTMILTSKIKK
ncbi:MAG: translation initiation factor IF-3 [Bacilli bacterium]|jgi:translation initiation factor IF-3